MTTTTSSAPSSPRNSIRLSRWALFLFLALVAGGLLRLSYGGDIEYKGDETYTFLATQRVGVSEPWPWLGMPSSAKIRNPGMSVWVFLLLSRLAGAQSPVDLARAVALLNIAALALLVFAACRLVAAREREPWLWAAALAAVNPVAVVLHRKIWAQSVLPFFSVLFLIGWLRRETRTGAFLWGLMSACLGQIHMSGFFFAAGFAAWAALFDRRPAGRAASPPQPEAVDASRSPKRVAWLWWATGAALGALPMIPWALYVLHGADGGSGGGTAAPPHGFDITKLLRLRYALYWINDPLGLYLQHTLGQAHFGQFLRYPLLRERPTYLVGLLHGAVVLIAAYVLVAGGRALWRARGDWRSRLIGASSETAFTQSAALWAYGFLLTLLTPTVFQHYLPIVFPLTGVWLARAALTAKRNGRWALGALWCAQLLLSALFLHYIHINGGAPGGDYGVAYARQR